MPPENQDHQNLPSEVPDLEGQVMTQGETEVREPPLYRVLLINDDYTPMDFVVWVLQNIFHKSSEDSTRIMLQVHTQGSGLCGIFPMMSHELKFFRYKL